MKKTVQFLCTAALAVSLSGCSGENEFTIKGTVNDPNLEGMTVYMLNCLDNSNGPTDSTIIEGGHFTLKGTVEEPWMAMIGVTGSAFTPTVVVEPGKIVVVNDSVGGTPLNDRFQAHVTGMDTRALGEELETYMQLYYTAQDAEMRADAERLYDSVNKMIEERMREANWKLYNENRDNVLGLMAMSQLTIIEDFSYGKLDSLVREASPYVQQSAMIKAKLEQLRAVDATSAGRHFTDIEGSNGKLSEVIEGKVALVDFFASWCGPCRIEIKDNLVPLWKKYRNRGLLVVGINVWEHGDEEKRAADLQKVVEELGIDYPVIVEPTMKATTDYGVEGIPQIMLIDKDGTILARDLRGKDIEESVKRALGF